MFAKQLIVIAAAVALAISNVAAVEEATHIKLHISKAHAVHHQVKSHQLHSKQVNETEGSGIDIDIDVYESGSGSEATGDDDLVDSSEGSMEGSYAGSDAGSDAAEGSNEEGSGGDWYGTGHGGDDICSGEGESPMSVEGVEGIFCVSGDACAGVEGTCPGPQDGLPFGAHCGTVLTGALGCIRNTEAPVCTGEGESEMSVEGAEGIYCVTGQACAGVEGVCPEAQDGLPYGSHCAIVETGILGCKVNDAKHHKKSHFAKHPAHFKPSHYKPGHVKAAKISVAKKPAHKVVVKKVEAKKPAHKVAHKAPAHKAAVHKVEAKKPAHKAAAHKATVHKVEAKKPAHKAPAHKATVHKVEAKKPAHKAAHKVEHKAAHKVEHKAAAHKAPAHKAEHKKVDAHHKKPAVVVKKIEHKH